MIQMKIFILLVINMGLDYLQIKLQYLLFSHIYTNFLLISTIRNNYFWLVSVF